MTRDWIVIAGQLIDNTEGGGFEFFGPFTKEQAKVAADHMREVERNPSRTYQQVQLLGYTYPMAKK
jgi:hypothetical protein